MGCPRCDLPPIEKILTDTIEACKDREQAWRARRRLYVDSFYFFGGTALLPCVPAQAHGAWIGWIDFDLGDLQRALQALQNEMKQEKAEEASAPPARWLYQARRWIRGWF